MSQGGDKQPQVLVQEGNTIRAAPGESNPMSAQAGTGGQMGAPNNPAGGMPWSGLPPAATQGVVGSKVGMESGGDARLQAATGGAGTSLATGDTPAGGDAYPQEARAERDRGSGIPQETQKLD